MSASYGQSGQVPAGEARRDPTGRSDGTTYTAWNDPLVDQFVQSQLDLIVRRVRVVLRDRLSAIVLAGGFGRGEGSVLKGSDGRLRIVNDYDIEVFLGGRLNEAFGNLFAKLSHRRRLVRLAERLADELGIKQVDIGLRPMTASVAAGDKVRLADYDLRHGYRLLYGDVDPLARLPLFRPEQIAVFEGTWLLRNRGIGLLLAGLYFDDEGTLLRRHRENFYIEINKAFLAAGDALFILKGAYECSYAERARRIDRVAGDGPPWFARLRECYARAAEYKLRPVEVMYPDTEPMALWRGARDNLLACFLFFESQRLQRPFPHLEAYAGWVLAQPDLGLGQCLKLLFRHASGDARGARASVARIGTDRARSTLLTMALLVELGGRAGEFAQSMHVVLSRLLGDYRAVELREIVAEFLMFAHPAGEVGRFLQSSKRGAA